MIIYWYLFNSKDIMEPYRTTYPPPDQPTLISSRPNSTSQDANTYQYKTLTKSNEYDRPSSNKYAYESQSIILFI